MRERRDPEFYQLSYCVNRFWKFRKFFWRKFYHLSKMSLQGTIVPGRLRSELCPWGVKKKVRPNKVTALSQVIFLGNFQKWRLHFEIKRWCFRCNQRTFPMLASFRLWFWCWLRLLRRWMGTYSRDCFTLTSSEIVSDFNTWKWLNFSSELMLKSLKTKDAKKCKLIQQKKWFVLVALVVAKMLARVTQERIHLSKPSTDPWVWQFESVFVR